MASTTALPPPTSISRQGAGQLHRLAVLLQGLCRPRHRLAVLLQGLCRPLHRLAVCCKACAGHFIGWLFYCKACAGRIVCRLCLLRGLCRPFHLPAVFATAALSCHALPAHLCHDPCLLPTFILPRSVLHSPPSPLVHCHVRQDHRANFQGLL